MMYNGAVNIQPHLFGGGSYFCELLDKALDR